MRFIFSTIYVIYEIKLFFKKKRQYFLFELPFLKWENWIALENEIYFLREIVISTICIIYKILKMKISNILDLITISKNGKIGSAWKII